MKVITIRRPAVLLLLAIGCCFYAAEASVVAAPGSNAYVTITYVDCPKNAETHSNISLTVFGERGAIVNVKTSTTNVGKGVRTIKSAVPPGFYDIAVTSGRCSDELLVTVLPGHDRHLLAVGKSEALLRSNRNTLAGTVPFEGARVAVVYRDRQPVQGQTASPDGYLQIPAMVEGAAYYAIDLPPGIVTVRLYNQGGYRWFDFDAGKVGFPNGPAHSIRNVTATELFQKLIELSRQSAKCVPGRGGITVCTPPA